MKKRTGWLSLVIISAWTAIGFTAAPHAVAREDMTISGQAVFEKRNTLIPMALCEDEETNCPTSRPYWSLIIVSEGAKFELNRAFELGRTEAPPAVHIAGALIRPGSSVEIHGRVQPISADYAIISEVHRAVVLEEPPVSAGSPAAYGWKCRGTRQDTPEMYADVFYNPEGRYQLRVVEAAPGDDAQFAPIAIVEAAKFLAGDQGFSYSGRYGSIYVQLDIDNQPERSSNLPASLMVMQGGMGALGTDTRSQFELRCTRTR